MCENISKNEACGCSPLYSNGNNRMQSHKIARGGIMSKGLQLIKENNNLAEWSRQVEECRTSGLSVRSWCEQHQIAVSTFHYRQQRVWKRRKRVLSSLKSRYLSMKVITAILRHR